MDKLGRYAALACALTFGCFVANVSAGAFFQASFLSDIGEMLMLFAASVFFVVLILVRERQALESPADQTGDV